MNETDYTSEASQIRELQHQVADLLKRVQKLEHPEIYKKFNKQRRAPHAPR